MLQHRRRRQQFLACSLLTALQCCKFPSLFQQWKQAITPYPLTSLMAFSAMLCAAVMEHPLAKIHMASCLKISAVLSSLLPIFFFLLSHVLVARLLESVSFPLSTPNNFNNIWRYDTFSPNWGLLNSKDLPSPYFSNPFKENSLYWDINSDTQTDLICINNMFHVF